MGILLIVLFITIVFSCLWYAVRDYDNLLSEIIFPLISIFSLVTLISLICMILISYIAVPANSIKLDEEYKSIQYQIKNAQYENEVSKKLLIDQIKEWNSELEQNKHYHNSFWTNAFFPVNYNDYEYVELEEND